MTQVLAVRSAFPARRYPQAELTRAAARLAGLGPSRRAQLERLHRNAGVRARHTVLPLEDYAALGGIGPANDRYIEEATDLGERALRAALDDSGAAAGDVDLLVVTSVTGVAVPSLDARLIPRLGLRADIKRLPVFGLGCVAGAVGLSRVHDYLRGWPGHTAALLAVELCSLTWRTEAATTADMVASGLFGDGAAAVIAAGDQAVSEGGWSQGLPGQGDRGQGDRGQGGSSQGGQGRRGRAAEVVATHGEVYPGSGDTLGWRLGSDGFGIVLTAGLADVVERRLAGTVSSFLASAGLTAGDIATWICHPGGPKVLDAIRDSLKLPEAALALSRDSLAQVGNVSSASVLHVMEKAGERPPRPGSFGLMIGLGPGVTVELVLLRW